MRSPITSFLLASALGLASMITESNAITYPIDGRSLMPGYGSSAVLTRGINLAFCSATVIAEGVAITAAHCNARVGEKIMFVDDLVDDTPDTQARSITKFLPHPGYKFRVLKERPSPYSSSTGKQGRTMYDIALVFFDGSLPDHIIPAKLSERIMDDDFEFSGIGYGDYRALKTVKDLPFPIVKMRAYKGAITAVKTGKYYELGEHVIQMKSNVRGSYWCYGDSGGGLFSRKGDEDVLEGVESYVLGDPRNVECDREVAHFVRIDKLYEWITGSIEAASTPDALD
jgi:hypothetical protein